MVIPCKRKILEGITCWWFDQFMAFPASMKDKLFNIQKLSSQSSLLYFFSLKIKYIIGKIVSLQQKNGLWRANLF